MDQPPNSTPQTRQNLSGRKRKNVEAALLDFIQAPIPVATTEPNVDRAFFESLLPTVCAFSEDEKLEYRSDVLNIVRQIRKRRRDAQSYSQNYTHQSTPMNPASPLRPPTQPATYSPHVTQPQPNTSRPLHSSFFWQPHSQHYDLQESQPSYSRVNSPMVSPNSVVSPTSSVVSQDAETDFDIYSAVE